MKPKSKAPKTAKPAAAATRRAPAARQHLPEPAFNVARWPAAPQPAPLDLPPAVAAAPVTRCLALRSLFAWLTCRGYKSIENRPWETAFRGRIAIYASLTPDTIDARRMFAALDADLRDDLGAAAQIPIFDPAQLARGAIIGTVELADCFAFDEPPAADGAAPESLYDHCRRCEPGANGSEGIVAAPHVWATGPFCFVFQRAEFFREAIPCEGRLNLFHLPPEVAQRVNAARKTARAMSR